MSKPSRRATRGTARPGGVPTSGRTVPDAGGTTTTGRVGGTRVGRRERPRTGYARQSVWERFRGPIMALAVVVGVVVIGAFMIGQAGAKTYTCGEEWVPEPTPSPAPGSTPDYGYVQPDMGNNHGVGQPQRYATCPPASGNHHNLPGRGPIQPRFYGRDDFAEPPGWIHNLEHGGLVVLYRGRDGDPGIADPVQQQMRDYWPNVPNSPICGFAPGVDDKVVIARFDDMAWPFAAIVWGRVLPLDTLDTEAINTFWLAEAERTAPEGPSARCPDKLVSPSPAVVAPTASPPASVAPSASPAASPAAS